MPSREATRCDKKECRFNGGVGFCDIFPVPILRVRTDLMVVCDMFTTEPLIIKVG